MREILPGVHHWTSFHEPIGMDVSSYFVAPAGVAIDPKAPSEDLPGDVEQVVLTIGLHNRDATQVADAHDATIRAPREAEHRELAFVYEPYSDGDELAPGVTAIQIGAICPDEYALHIAVGEGAIAFADGLIHYGGSLAFVPDGLLGDDPEGVKDGLREAFRELLTRDFDHLLFAHGDPLIGGGKAALREFVG
ncbi:MAG TPA: hypothetical protein VFZ89_19720 [Solirubrobacteraceae bacterium]